MLLKLNVDSLLLVWAGQKLEAGLPQGKTNSVCRAMIHATSHLLPWFRGNLPTCCVFNVLIRLNMNTTMYYQDMNTVWVPPLVCVWHKHAVFVKRWVRTQLRTHALNSGFCPAASKKQMKPNCNWCGVNQPHSQAFPLSSFSDSKKGGKRSGPFYHVNDIMLLSR